MSRLPDWPTLPSFESRETESRVFSAYYRERYAAAMARLAVAVEALKGCRGGWSGLADKALAAIGEIPNEPVRMSAVRQCACVSADARECVRIRYRNVESCELDDTYAGWDDDQCQCCCHDQRDDERDDYVVIFAPHRREA